MYTHNWGLFLAVGTGAAFLLLLGGDPDKRGMLRDAVLAYGAVAHRLPAVGAEPAVPGEAHRRAVVRGARCRPTRSAGSSRSSAGRRRRWRSRWRRGSGLAGLLVGPRLRGPKARAVLALLTMGLVALALAWVTSQISPAWATRYLSVLLGPLLLLGGAGLSRAGTLGLVVAAILAVLWLNPRTARARHEEQRPHRRRPRRGPPRAGRPRRRRPPRAGPGHAPLPAEGPALGERDRARSPTRASWTGGTRCSG